VWFGLDLQERTDELGLDALGASAKWAPSSSRPSSSTTHSSISTPAVISEFILAGVYAVADPVQKQADVRI
jgi:hypothetical protein